MNKKEIEQKLKNIPKDKYIYQRYDGRITKYKVSGEYYINVEGGIAINKNKQLMLGKVSENLIDLVEVGDYVNGYKVLGKEGSVLYTEVEGINRSHYHIPISQYVSGIKTILTHELYEENCYKVGGKDE